MRRNSHGAEIQTRKPPSFKMGAVVCVVLSVICTWVMFYVRPGPDVYNDAPDESTPDKWLWDRTITAVERPEDTQTYRKMPRITMHEVRTKTDTMWICMGCQGCCVRCSLVKQEYSTQEGNTSAFLQMHQNQEWRLEGCYWSADVGYDDHGVDLRLVHAPSTHVYKTWHLSRQEFELSGVHLLPVLSSSLRAAVLNDRGTHVLLVLDWHASPYFQVLSSCGLPSALLDMVTSYLWVLDH